MIQICVKLNHLNFKELSLIDLTFFISPALKNFENLKGSLRVKHMINSNFPKYAQVVEILNFHLPLLNLSFLYLLLIFFYFLNLGCLKNILKKI